MTHLPIVVEVAHFECQSLHVVRFQAVVIIDDIVVGGINSSSPGSLADQVKVIPEGQVECMWQGKTNTVKPKPKQSTMTAGQNGFLVLAIQDVLLLSPQQCPAGGSAESGSFP